MDGSSPKQKLPKPLGLLLRAPAALLLRHTSKHLVDVGATTAPGHLPAIRTLDLIAHLVVSPYPSSSSPNDANWIRRQGDFLRSWTKGAGTSTNLRYAEHMLPVYLAENLPDAHLLADRLKAEGIATYIRNEALQGALGELPLTCHPEVCVLNEHDLARARRIAHEHDMATRRAVSTGERLCPECGETSPDNFELCWSCRNPFETARPDT